MTSDAMELKPCPNPWCEAEERDGDFSPQVCRTSFGNWQVCCTSCPQKGPVTTNALAAMTAWNTRTTSLAAQDGLVEALEVLLGYVRKSRQGYVLIPLAGRIAEVTAEHALALAKGEDDYARFIAEQLAELREDSSKQINATNTALSAIKGDKS